MNEERTGKCLRQTEHIRGHLLHLRVLRFHLLIKLTADITEILLKAAFNTNTITGGCQHNFSEKTCHLIIVLVDTICSTLKKRNNDLQNIQIKLKIE
jgi:hypothetical protein